jgi:hypothetical protein
MPARLYFGGVAEGVELLWASQSNVTGQDWWIQRASAGDTAKIR